MDPTWLTLWCSVHPFAHGREMWFTARILLWGVSKGWMFWISSLRATPLAGFGGSLHWVYCDWTTPNTLINGKTNACWSRTLYSKATQQRLASESMSEWVSMIGTLSENEYAGGLFLITFLLLLRKGNKTAQWSCIGTLCDYISFFLRSLPFTFLPLTSSLTPRGLVSLA